MHRPITNPLNTENIKKKNFLEKEREVRLESLTARSFWENLSIRKEYNHDKRMLLLRLR